MVEGSCHCGKVRIEIDTAPEVLAAARVRHIDGASYGDFTP